MAIRFLENMNSGEKELVDIQLCSRPARSAPSQFSRQVLHGFMTSFALPPFPFFFPGSVLFCSLLWFLTAISARVWTREIGPRIRNCKAIQLSKTLVNCAVGTAREM